MTKGEWAIVLVGGVFILAVLLFIPYCMWTGFAEAQVRSRHHRDVVMLEDLTSGRAEFSPDALARVRTGDIVPLASLLKTGDRDTPLHALVAKDILLIYDQKPEDGPGLLRSIEALGKPEDLFLLRYDPTNGTDSAGHEFLVLPHN